MADTDAPLGTAACIARAEGTAGCHNQLISGGVDVSIQPIGKIRLSKTVKKLILTPNASAGVTILQQLHTIRPDWRTCVVTSSDDYSQGPIPATTTSGDFFHERQTFWKSLDLYSLDYVGIADLSEEYRLMVNEIKSVQKAEIWIGDSVQDIFYAVTLLHLLTLDKVDTSGILVRQYGGEQVKWGLGAVSAEELEELYKSSVAEPFNAKLYSGAWNAISQGSTAAIKLFIQNQQTTVSMFKALSAYLLRFPEYNGGLGSIERLLLGAGTEQKKKSAYTIGMAMALASYQSDHIGDLMLFKYLVDLARAPSDPWFILDGDLRNMRNCSAQLTESGIEARARFSVKTS